MKWLSEILVVNIGFKKIMLMMTIALDIAIRFIITIYSEIPKNIQDIQ